MRAFAGWVLAGALLFCTAASSAASERLIIAGTGDSLQLLDTLGRAFDRSHPGGITEVPPSVGSSGGIKRLLQGDCHLARIARPLNHQELQFGLGYAQFADSPVVFVANLPAPCLDKISSGQVVEVFAGRIKTWDQLNPACENHKIYVANREEGDSSRRVIEQRLPAFKAITSFAGEVLYSTQENLRILERYPYTIGYLPLASAQGSPLKILALDGLLPQPSQKSAKDYPLVVPLGIVWTGNLQGVRRQFVEYLFSPEARELMLANGAMPAPAGHRPGP